MGPPRPSSAGFIIRAQDAEPYPLSSLVASPAPHPLRCSPASKRVASALLARCSGVASVLLRRGFDGVTTGLRRGYDGIGPFLPPRAALWFRDYRLHFFVQVRSVVHLSPEVDEDALARQLHVVLLDVRAVLREVDRKSTRLNSSH